MKTATYIYNHCSIIIILASSFMLSPFSALAQMAVVSYNPGVGSQEITINGVTYVGNFYDRRMLKREYIFEVYTVNDIDKILLDLNNKITAAEKKTVDLSTSTDDKLKGLEEKIKSEVSESINKIPQRILVDDVIAALKSSIESDFRKDLDEMRQKIEDQNELITELRKDLNKKKSPSRE